MKTTLYPIVLMAYAVATSQSGEFVNLTFDEPDLSRARYRDYPPGLVAPLEDVFRGWSIQWDWTGEPKPRPECVGVHGGDIPLGLVAMGTAPYGSYLVLVSEFWAEYGGSCDQRCTFGRQARFLMELRNLRCIKADWEWEAHVLWRLISTGRFNIRWVHQGYRRFPPLTFLRSQVKK